MGVDLPVSGRNLVPFTPAGWKAEKAGQEPPVYQIAVPTGILKSRWLRDVSRETRDVTWAEVIESLREFARTKATSDEDRALLLAQIDRYWELLVKDDRDEEERREFAQSWVQLVMIERAAMDGSADTRKIIAAWEYRNEVERLLAAKHFLRGWKNVARPCEECPPAPEGEGEKPVCRKCGGSGEVPIDFSLDDGLVSDAALGEIPPEHVVAIGAYALTLKRLNGRQRKN